jgi:hypothetical protein
VCLSLKVSSQITGRGVQMIAQSWLLLDLDFNRIVLQSVMQ